MNTAHLMRRKLLCVLRSAFEREVQLITLSGATHQYDNRGACAIYIDPVEWIQRPERANLRPAHRGLTGCVRDSKRLGCNDDD